MTTPAPEESLWSFALAVYARPGVADACLDLQDRRGADVTLLLFALWAGAACGARLSDAVLRRLSEEAAAWQGAVVAPLRDVRRHLKGIPGAEALRERVKAAELDAERLALVRLCRASGLRPRRPGPPMADADMADAGAAGAAEANLRRLVRDDDAALALLLDAARNRPA